MAVTDKQILLPIGVVVRKTPGVTRWAEWCWRAVAVLPGAGPADWRELRCEGEAVEYHAATVTLDLHHTQTESYLEGLRAPVPSVYVIMRPVPAGAGEMPYEVTLVTASPYEAQDYCDTGEEIVEKVPMPEGVIALVHDFVAAHHVEEVFQKRRRDRANVNGTQDGIGDARIPQAADVYRAPALARKERLH
ncbi:DUF3305 domain-containing protein [Roseovarius autotrophicus]|uniref:DUF3305 domain-containing protein n=1 Tax=Roseovarius autotrophicus TaxID=2824121 RepID=UPI003AB9B019